MERGRGEVRTWFLFVCRERGCRDGSESRWVRLSRLSSCAGGVG